jgi:hypothetical protein
MAFFQYDLKPKSLKNSAFQPNLKKSVLSSDWFTQIPTATNTISATHLSQKVLQKSSCDGPLFLVMQGAHCYRFETVVAKLCFTENVVN